MSLLHDPSVVSSIQLRFAQKEGSLLFSQRLTKAQITAGKRGNPHREISSSLAVYTLPMYTCGESQTLAPHSERGKGHRCQFSRLFWVASLQAARYRHLEE